MTKRNRKAHTPVKRSNARRKSRNFNNRDRSVLPPAKTLMGHLLRTVVQTAWDIAQGALSIPDSHSLFNDDSHILLSQPSFAPAGNPVTWTAWNLDNGWLLAQGWLDRFKGLFKEVKVHKITAHYMPYESITAVGEYAFALWDKDQDAGPSSFSETIGTPSSVIRKNGQPARLVWYPTEPDDRNWHQLTDDHIWCSSCLFQAESVYNVDPAYTPGTSVRPNSQIVGVEGKVVIDVDASFRGKPTKPTTGTTICTCRKCLRLIIPRLMPTSTSGSTTPFSMVS